MSPGPSGTPQADIYRSLRLPAVLVGDHKLGGISSTISAAESLIMRGYNLNAVICFEDKSMYKNGEYLTKYFDGMDIPVFSIPWIPNDLDGKPKTEERAMMEEYYQSTCGHPEVLNVAEHIVDRHNKRTQNIESMASRTHKTIWHPFTQHKHVKQADDVLVFDSAYGDYFQVKRTPRGQPDGELDDASPMLYPAFDGSASWWTQGKLPDLSEIKLC
jgi:bifunctional dethiobiotin synthetase / adenosylmethionine---8-amino-7-oxononanoate aminotransferase